MPNLPFLAALILVAGSIPSPAMAQSAPSSASSSALRSETLSFHVPFRYRYLLALPDGYDPAAAERWPLVVFLHGLGERGDDLDLVAKYGPTRLVRLGQRFPFILAAPQCPDTSWWNAPAVDQFVEELCQRLPVDRNRVYLTGLSMGGYGTWAVAQLNPDRYAAIAPICGGGDPKRAAVLRDLPIWTFHGQLDTVVPFERTQEMVEAIRAAGGEPRFTVYPDVTHNAWTPAYDTAELYTWLLSHRRRDRPAVAKP